MRFRINIWVIKITYYRMSISGFSNYSKMPENLSKRRVENENIKTNIFWQCLTSYFSQ